ncbi:hypothetical protein Plim_0939 [Planctopirus limnophila DSM 3776]|uniref:Uncharacterized protein n=1 Tax=Planctopirus limnophila (strain ATCC 43296 / DSM 3776 / IFAM 1008 / Mu 290) TaxID=521674 RepID=D5ST15_PLAL2|nr:hypothetical protein Plim_0939 [Planctopirus limnophila DSM 3776]
MALSGPYSLQTLHKSNDGNKPHYRLETKKVIAGGVRKMVRTADPTS